MQKFSLLLISVLVFSCSGHKEQEKVKPNIIFIFTDQQNASMMSCAGNEWLKTPAMDYLAENGIRFTRAYTANPVCSPSRVSLMTGRMAGFFSDNEGNQVRENGGSMNIPQVPAEILNTTIASFLSKAGYDLYYGGKEHLPPSLSPEKLGFIDFCDDERWELAKKADSLIRAKHERPYFMFVSLINPHDICYMAIREYQATESARRLVERGSVEIAHLDSALKIPDGLSNEEFLESYCPPVPVNYEPQFEEPEAIRKLIQQRPFRLNARENFTDEQWRMHRYAYHRLTEFVDSKIDTILNSIRMSGQEENTMVIFSSDHGDNDASHRLEHKSVLYEESANIPFIVMWRGHIDGGLVDDQHLISNGLDLLPTLCDYAGIEGVADPRGRSLRPLLEGRTGPVEWRTNLGVESEIGRMVIDSDGYKYIKYDAAGPEEQLLDLNTDPHETTHFTNDPAYQHRLKMLRTAYDSIWFQ